MVRCKPRVLPISIGDPSPAAQDDIFRFSRCWFCIVGFAGWCQSTALGTEFILALRLVLRIVARCDDFASRMSFCATAGNAWVVGVGPRQGFRVQMDSVRLSLRRAATVPPAHLRSRLGLRRLSRESEPRTSVSGRHRTQRLSRAKAGWVRTRAR